MCVYVLDGIDSSSSRGWEYYPRKRRTANTRPPLLQYRLVGTVTLIWMDCVLKVITFYHNTRGLADFGQKHQQDNSALKRSQSSESSSPSLKQPFHGIHFVILFNRDRLLLSESYLIQEKGTMNTPSIGISPLHPPLPCMSPVSVLQHVSWSLCLPLFQSLPPQLCLSPPQKGSNCHRKNPENFKEYRHLHGVMKNNQFPPPPPGLLKHKYRVVQKHRQCPQ